MANSAGVSYAAKLAALGHLVTGVTTFKAALFFNDTGNAGPDDDTYGDATGECTGTNYSAGGVAVTNGVAAALDGAIAHWTPGANIVYNSGGNITITTNGGAQAVMLYDTNATNRNLCVITFNAQVINDAPFSLTIPTNNGSTGLVRFN